MGRRGGAVWLWTARITPVTRRGAAALAVALVATTPGCARTHPDTTVRHETVAGQPAEIWPVRGGHAAVVLAHGYQGDERLLAGRAAALAERLHREGWVVAATLAHGNAWGDEESVRDYEALVERLRTGYGVTRVAVIGVSMGALPGLELVARGRAATFVGVSAVTDPATLTHGTLRASIARVPDPRRSFDMDVLRAADVTFVADPADDIVPTSSNSAAFARAVGKPLRDCHGGHTSTDCLLAAADVLGQPQG